MLLHKFVFYETKVIAKYDYFFIPHKYFAIFFQQTDMGKVKIRHLHHINSPSKTKYTPHSEKTFNNHWEGR